MAPWDCLARPDPPTVAELVDILGSNLDDPSSADARLLRTHKAFKVARNALESIQKRVAGAAQ